MEWEELQRAPAFCINLERRDDRREGLLDRLRGAGFEQVSIWPAVDAQSENLEALFETHGLGTLIDVDRFPARRGSQGALLSHLGLLAHAIQHELPLVHIFEDDVVFPPIWTSHAEAFYRATPMDWDVLFLGSQLLYKHLPTPSLFRFLQRHPRLKSASSRVISRPTQLLQDIVRCPLFCTHAYTLTQAGCRLLYGWLTSQPVVYGYDYMICDGMRNSSRVSPLPLKWYAWNSLRLFPDEPSRGVDPAITQRNRGLVFQLEEDGPLWGGDKL
ncbi:glycosyltransferase family 25 protein [Synechococcus sp. CS-1332]|nr:glycosyltransferase family 25 protein [Synechococcus sp. CS-1332]